MINLPQFPQLSVRQIIGLIAVTLLALTAIIQTLRIELQPIELPFGIRIGHEGFAAKVARLETENKGFITASIKAKAEAIEQTRATEARYSRLAKETDNEIEQAIADERARADRFVAAGGVPDNAVCPRGPAATASDQGTRSGAPVRSAPQLDDAQPRLSDARPTTVRVFAEDVGICTDNTILAEQLRQHLLKLEADSQAAQLAPSDQAGN